MAQMHRVLVLSPPEMEEHAEMEKTTDMEEASMVVPPMERAQRWQYRKRKHQRRRPRRAQRTRSQAKIGRTRETIPAIDTVP